MSDIRLSVAASLDEDVSGLFRPLPAVAERWGELSGKAYAKGFKRGSAGIGGGAPTSGAGAGASGGAAGRPRATPEEQAQARKARSEEQAKAYVARIRDRYFAQEQKQQEKQERDHKQSLQRQERNKQQQLQRQEQEEKRRSERTEAENKRRVQTEQKAAEAEQQRKVKAAERAQAHVARIRDRHLREEQRQEERARAHVAGIKERYFRDEQQKQERAERLDARKRQRAAELEDREGRSFGQRTSYSAARSFERLATSGVRYAADFARSAGVQLDLGGAVGQAVDLRRMASQLSNSAYMPGANGANGKRADARELERLARDTGNMAGFDATETLSGLQAFVGKTGDLSTGRDILKEMAVLAKATGTDLGDMISAAGDAANAISETPGALGAGESKAAKIAALMRTIAGQGKLGAVEISNLATQMAKLAASSTAFEGSDVANLADMGTLVQMARAKGGASSATSAATSVASFVGMIKTPARMKEFEKQTGEKIYDEKTGKFKSVEDIVTKSLEATGGDPMLLKKIFANVQGARAVEGFATTYRDAGGGTAGIAAVKAEFEKFRKIQMGEGEIKESFNRRMNDYDSQVTLFNNKVSEIGAALAEKLLPKLNQAAPMVLKFVGAMGDLVAWAAQNPFRAVVAALGASILKAGIESVLRSGIETALKSAFSGSGGGVAGLAGGGIAGSAGSGGAGAKGGMTVMPGAPAGKLGGALATAGAAVAIAATAVTITEVGTLAIDKVFQMKENAEANAMKREIELSNQNSADKMAIEQARVNQSPEELRKRAAVLMGQGRIAEAAELERDAAMGTGKTVVNQELYSRISSRKDSLDAQVQAAQAGPLREDDPFSALSNDMMFGYMAKFASGALSYMTAGSYGTSFDAQTSRTASADRLPELKAEQQRTNELLAGIKAGVEKGGMPGTPTAGTTGITP